MANKTEEDLKYVLVCIKNNFDWHEVARETGNTAKYLANNACVWKICSFLHLHH